MIWGALRVQFIKAPNALRDHMKRRVEKENEADLMARYPIKGKISGWYFRITEVSNGAWQVDGSDQWGRQVSRTGTKWCLWLFAY